MGKAETKTGYFKNGLPYARFGNGSQNLIIFNGLDMVHKPPSNMRLRMVTNAYNCLIEDYTVYLVTRKSGMPTGYSIKDMSEDYATMIKEEYGSPVDIMGVSAGGEIAQQFAIDHSDLINHLVLAATSYRISDEGKEMMLSVCDLARKGKGRKVSTTVMGCVYTHGVKKYLFKSLMWLFPYMMFDPITGPSDGAIEMEAVLGFDFKDQLASINTPTLVVGGDQDFFSPLSILRETAEGIPNSKLITYQGLGHDAAFSKQLAEDVLKFLTMSNE